MESLNNVAIDLKATKRASRRQTVQNIYSSHLITIRIIHCHKKGLLTRGIRLLGSLTEASTAQINQLLFEAQLTLTGGFAEGRFKANHKWPGTSTAEPFKHVD